MSVSNKNIHEFPIGNTIENGNIQVDIGKEEIKIEETFSIKMKSKSKKINTREIYKFFDKSGDVTELEIEGKNIIGLFNNYEDPFPKHQRNIFSFDRKKSRTSENSWPFPIKFSFCPINHTARHSLAQQAYYPLNADKFCTWRQSSL